MRRRAESERRLAERRQDEQRELEVKTALLARIGSSSASFLSAIEVGTIDGGAREARAEYRALKTASLEIGSQLAAYFPRSRPLDRWRDYSSGLRQAYLLLTAKEGPQRSFWLYQLNRYLDVDATQTNGLCKGTGTSPYAHDLRVLVVALQKKEETIVRQIVDSDTVLTGTPLRDVDVPRRKFVKAQRFPCGKPGA